MRPVLLSLIALGSGACSHGGERAPDCGAVGARMFQIASDALAGAALDDSTRREVADRLPAMRDALATVCADDRWAPEIRACLASAPDHATFEACEARLGDAQRADLDRAAAVPPSSP